MASGLTKACKDLTLNESLRVILECPVCFNVCLSPIFMCSNGHHICNSCQRSVTACPTCRVEGKPTTRCPTLEKISDEVKIRPCANKREGCEEVLNATDMAQHWEACKGKYTYTCWVFISVSDLYTRCKWKGDREALVAHVKETHPGSYSEDDVMQCDVAISFKEDVEYWRLVSAHGELFWVALWYDPDENRAHIWSWYIGKKENAVNYRGKFVYSSNDGCFENTSVVNTLASNTFINSSPTNGMRLLKATLEECMLEGIFSFTAQIIKR